MFSDNKDVSDSSVRPLAKQTRLPFSKYLSVSTALFDLVHMDVCGPYNVSTHDKKNKKLFDHCW